MTMNGGSEIIQYTIQSGDTLWELANQNNTTIEDIMAANPGIDPYNLMIGQVISIPDPPPMPERRRGGRPEYRRPERFRRPFCRAGNLYTIQPGDTLYRISYRFGLSPSEIIARNPYINFNYPLQVGQALCLPYR